MRLSINITLQMLFAKNGNCSCFGLLCLPAKGWGQGQNGKLVLFPVLRGYLVGFNY